MYVCICKVVTVSQIRQAISQGACTRKQLIECLSVGRACGKCNAEVRELLNEYGMCLNTSWKTGKSTSTGWKPRSALSTKSACPITSNAARWEARGHGAMLAIRVSRATPDDP